MSSSELVVSHVECEKCGSSDAKSIYSDGHGYCFSCNAYFPPENASNSGEFTYEYLPFRGITKETFKFFDVKTKIDGNGKPIALGFKYQGTIGVKVRPVDVREGFPKSYWEPKGADLSNASLFGMDKFAAGGSKSITITEGELDALSLYQVLRLPVVSVKSASSASSDCASARDWLNSFDRIYLAFDNDVAGREATKSVAKLFDYNKVYHVKFTNRKDANEYLQHGEGQVLKDLWWNSKKFLPETIVSSFDDFRKILQEPPKRGIAYPYPTLTQMTYGIRTGETVLLTAKEKVGKTSLMHDIEYHLLKETDDAIGAIFLEEPKIRHLQSLASIALKRPCHLPDQAGSVDEVVSAIESLVRTDDRLHIYSHFGSADPEVILDTIRFLATARACKYIMFDHISMAVSGLFGTEERQALEYLSTRLEMMVKELDFALIMVSHVNDQGQTRSSHWLTKVADIVINAERNTMHPDPIQRRTIKLSVPFNRFSCSSGPAGSIVFDPETYLLKEELGFNTPANDNLPWENSDGLRAA